MFNWLQATLPGSACLDAFAGSGALGFEAASRGASRVVMLEKNRAALRNLQQNIDTLSAQGVSAQQADTLHWLGQACRQQKVPPPVNEAGFDLVFLDPPFRAGLLEESCRLLAQSGLLRPLAKIYIEHALNDSIDLPPDWRCLKSKTAGAVAYKLYQHDGHVDQL